MSDKKHDSSKETDKKNNPGSGQQNPGSGHERWRPKRQQEIKMIEVAVDSQSLNSREGLRTNAGLLQATSFVIK